MAERVSSTGRILDLLGLILFVVGGGVFVRAWLGFQSVRHYNPSPDDRPWAAMHLANGYQRLQHVGGIIMLAGVAVFVAAWWIAGRRAPAAESVDIDGEAVD